jgi:hypothetical protein
MEERAGLRGSVHDGIFFTEYPAPDARAVGRVTVAISRQNSNLFEVKTQMAIRAHRLGANAIVTFRYGQRAHRGLTLLSLFKWDTESWYGEGDAVVL